MKENLITSKVGEESIAFVCLLSLFVFKLVG